MGLGSRRTDLATLLRGRAPGLVPSRVLAHRAQAAEGLTDLHPQTEPVIHGDTSSQPIRSSPPAGGSTWSTLPFSSTTRHRPLSRRGSSSPMANRQSGSAVSLRTTSATDEPGGQRPSRHTRSSSEAQLSCRPDHQRAWLRRIRDGREVSKRFSGTELDSCFDAERRCRADPSVSVSGFVQLALVPPSSTVVVSRAWAAAQ